MRSRTLRTAGAALVLATAGLVGTTPGRADAAVDLFVQALARDMRGVQASVLPSTQHADRDSELDLVASAFARYPYPEVFVSARAPLTPGDVVFYTRVDRSAPWLPAPNGGSRQPASIAREPAIAADRKSTRLNSSHT